MSVSQVTAKSRLQGTGHAEFDARVHDQHLLIELIKPHGCEPLELTQQMQRNRLLGTTGAVFHLDGYSKTFTHAAEALNALCTALAQDLTMAAPHQLGVETTLTGHKVGVTQHRPTDLLEFGML